MRLGDVAKVKHGFAFEGVHFTEEPRPDVLLTPGNFEIGGGFKLDKLKFYNGVVPEEYVLAVDDLVVTMTDLSKAGDTLGYPALIPARPGLRFLHNQRIGKVLISRPDLVDKHYVYWLMRSSEYRSEILAGATGTTVKHTAPGRIEGFNFAAPPIAQQRVIAHILDTLDDKIELNRRMNVTLEAMARALFKSWFIDFDPVRAKAEGRQPSGMDAATAKLFPSDFQASTLGPIPKGWRVGTLGHLATLNPEVWSKSNRPPKLEYIDLSSTKWGRMEAAAHYSRDVAPSRAQRVLRPGDTIVGTVRPGNGSYALVHGSGLTGSTGFAVLRPTRPAYTAFVYLAATERGNIDRLAHLADGGAYPAVRPEQVAETPTTRPDEAVLAHFQCIAGQLYQRATCNDVESRALGAVRDALLPRLLSGGVDLSVVQQHVAAGG